MKSVRLILVCFSCWNTPSLTNEWVKPAASGPLSTGLSSCQAPSPWLRQQQAPVWLSAPLRLSGCVCARVFYCKFMLFPFWLTQCLFPFCLFSLCAWVHVCTSSRKISFCLRQAYTFHTFFLFLLRFRFYFVNLQLSVKYRGFTCSHIS